jgi:hypothetical protein
VKRQGHAILESGRKGEESGGNREETDTIVGDSALSDCLYLHGLELMKGKWHAILGKRIKNQRKYYKTEKK